MTVRSYAQNFEDIILWRALSDVGDGFFIDIGAQDPRKDSVSKLFSEHGWRGIHVEPNSSYANLLRGDRPQDVVIQAAVSSEAGMVEFYVIDDTGLSTGVRDIVELHEKNGYQARRILVPSITIDDLLETPDQAAIHWLKIDVEGMEGAVLKSWERSERRPWIIVIEATSPGSQTAVYAGWEHLLLDKGYQHVYSDGLNRFYLSNEQKHLKDKFWFPPNIFDGFQLTAESDHAVEIVRLHEQATRSLEDVKKALEDKAQRLENELGAAHRASEERERRLREQAEEVAVRERAAGAAAVAREADLIDQIASLRSLADSIREAHAEQERQQHQFAEKAISEVRRDARDHLQEVLEVHRASTLSSEAREADLLRRADALWRSMDELRASLDLRETSLRAETEERVRALEVQKAKQRLEHQEAVREREARETRLRADSDEAVAELRRETQSRLDDAQRRLDEAFDRERAAFAVMAALQASHSDALLKATEKNALLSSRLIILSRYFERQNKAVGLMLSSRSWRYSSLLRALFGERSLLIALPNDALDWAILAEPLPEMHPRPEEPGRDRHDNSPPGSEPPQSSTNRDFQVCDYGAMSVASIEGLSDLFALSIPAFVASCYQVLLGRHPDADEIHAASAAVRSGCGRPRFITTVVRSPEFIGQQMSMLVDASDRAFLEDLYQKYLGREPDADGLGNYLAAMQKGQKRKVIRTKIAGSAEAARNRTFWFELDQLLEDEKMATSRLSRLWGRSARSERRHNLELEAAGKRNLAETSLRLELQETLKRLEVARREVQTAADSVDVMGQELEEERALRAEREIQWSQAVEGLERKLEENLIQPSPLALANQALLGPTARRVLSRLQKAGTTASLPSGSL